MLSFGTVRVLFLILSLLCSFETGRCNTCSIPAVCKCEVEQKPTNGVAEAPFSDQPAQPLLTSYFSINVPGLNVCEPPPTPIPPTTPPTKAPNTTTTTPKPPGFRSDPKPTPNIVLNCTYIEVNSNKTIPAHPAVDGSFFLTLYYPCPEVPSPHKGYSTGTDLLIIFFTLVFAYLALGIAVNFFILGARGIEMIPNLGFWRDLPGLVKDGVVFVQNGFKVPQTELHPRSPESYDAI